MKRNEHVEQHFRENYDTLVKRIKARSCSVPEDVVQEAYYRALKYYKSYSKDKDFDRWFNTILNNSLRSVKLEERERGIVRAVDEETLEDTVDEASEFVKELIQEIPDGREKQILVMYYILGFRTRDISEYMGLSHSNVRIILMRWRNNHPLST